MKLRFSLSSLLLLVTLAGVGIGLSKWWYEDYYVPRQPIPWIPYSEGIVDTLRDEGSIVLVHFTADWDPSVKLVEANFLDIPEVRKTIYNHGVMPVLANLTQQRGEDHKFFALWRKTADEVPVTMVFSANQASPPIVLSYTFNHHQFIQAIEAAATSPQSNPQSNRNSPP
jgi:thiol:disulfide interchange protein